MQEMHAVRNGNEIVLLPLTKKFVVTAKINPTEMKGNDLTNIKSIMPGSLPCKKLSGCPIVSETS